MFTGATARQQQRGFPCFISRTGDNNIKYFSALGAFSA
jgi:hypothetical protein